MNINHLPDTTPCLINNIRAVFHRVYRKSYAARVWSDILILLITRLDTI